MLVVVVHFFSCCLNPAKREREDDRNFLFSFHFVNLEDVECKTDNWRCVRTYHGSPYALSKKLGFV